MNNMMCYDLFLFEFVFDLFQGLFRLLCGMMLVDELDFVLMKIDVIENDNVYMVNVELFGVVKDDIDVQVMGNIVLINVKIECNNEQKDGECVIWCECYSGVVSCLFLLLGEIDDVNVMVMYQDGVLLLILLKKVLVGQKKFVIS